MESIEKKPIIELQVPPMFVPTHTHTHTHTHSHIYPVVSCRDILKLRFLSHCRKNIPVCGPLVKQSLDAYFSISASGIGT